jgi:hypothetical protein
MAAIDFPNSPTNGQTVTVGSSKYTWNAAAGTWDLSVATVVGPTGYFIPSDTAPSNPVSGMGWFNSTSGKTFIYYSGAWIEQVNDGPTGPTGPQGPTGPSVTGPTGATGPAGSDALHPFLLI